VDEAQEQDEVARAARDALEAALLKATQTVGRELTRIVKSGNDALDRLAPRIAETLAQLALDGLLGSYIERSTPASDTGASSMNRVAGSVGEAGATRFTLARFMR
jgi:uncharacterized heparinase superfamily protein